LTRSEGKKQDLVEAGADHVIVAGSEDVQEMILDMTEGLGAEVIYDAVAGAGLGKSSSPQYFLIPKS